MGKKDFTTFEKKDSSYKKAKTSSQMLSGGVPSFGYKSAAILMGMLIFSLIILPVIFSKLQIPVAWGTTIVGGLLSGYTLSYVQFVLERKEGFSRHFWLFGLLASVGVALLIFFLYFKGILL